MTTRPILTGIVAGVLLVIVRVSWFYVANRVAISEFERTYLKNALVILALVILAFIAITQSLSDSSDWWKSTAVAISTSLSVGAIGAIAAFGVAGVGQAANTTDAGMSIVSQWLSRGLTLVAFIAIVTALMILFGYVIRAVIPLRSKSLPLQ